MSFKRAFDLLMAFRRNVGGNKPVEDDVVEVDYKKSMTALVIGDLVGIRYAVEGAKLTFYHEFDKANRPLLLVSSDGSQIFVAQGSYRFTDRGFVK